MVGYTYIVYIELESSTAYEIFLEFLPDKLRLL